MVRLIVILGVGLALLSACAQRPQSPQNVVERKPVPKSVRIVPVPDVGEKARREVGDSIIEQQLVESVDAIVLKVPVNVPQAGAPRQVPAGTKFPHMSDAAAVQTYCAAFCLERQRASGTVSLVGSPEVVVPPSAFSNETVVTDTRRPSFQQNLVYTGRSGKTLFLSYREFSGDMARPAFTQDLTFDVSSDRVIGFRGARIEVINATNTAIDYRVLQGFPEAIASTRASARPDGGSVVCKRADGHVETMSAAQCAGVGSAI